jgi:hypothetical protein
VPFSVERADAPNPEVEPETEPAGQPDSQPEVEPVPARQRASALGAVAGAALAVCGVVLGISALLLAQPPPPQPTEPAGITSEEQDAGTAGTPAPSAAAASTPAPSPAATPAPTPAPSPAATPAPAVAPITVLNNSRIPLLAARAADRFSAAGWPVAATGNYRGRLSATTVFYGPGQEASARALAARFPGVERVQPRTATLPGSGLTVVLTRDFR